MKRLLLVLSLLPILSLLVYLALYAPFFDSRSGKLLFPRSQYGAGRSAQTAGIVALEGTNRIFIDLENQTVANIGFHDISYAQLRKSDNCLFRRVFIQQGSVGGVHTFELQHFDPDSRELLRSFRFQSPDGMEMLTSTVAVSKSLDGASVIAKDVSTDFQATYTPTLGTGFLWRPIEGTSAVLLTESPASGLRNGTAARNELLHFDGTNFVKIASWKSLTHGYSGALTYITPDRRFVRTRDVQTGKNRDSYSVPPNVFGPPGTQERWRFDGSIMTVQAATRPNKFFDLATGTQIKLQFNDLRLLAPPSPTAPLVFANYNSSNPHIEIIDRRDFRSIATLAPRSMLSTTYIDENRIAYLSSANGLSGGIIEVQTGKQLSSFSPYSWVIPVFIIAAAAFFVWCLLWQRHARSSNLSIWANAAFITSLAIAPFLVRHGAKVPFSIDSAETTFSMAIFAGLLHTTLIWLLLSSSRVSIRAIPWFVLTTIVFSVTALAGTWLEISTWSASIVCWYTICATAVSSATLLPARLVGFRVTPPYPTDSSDHRRQVFSMREVLLGVTAVAIFIAALRPHSFHLQDLIRIQTYSTPMIVSGAIASGLSLFSYVNNRQIYSLVSVLHIVLFCALIGLLSFEFWSGRPAIPDPGIAWTSKFIATALISAYLLSIPFRNSGRCLITPRAHRS